MIEEAFKTKYAYSFDFTRDKGPAAGSHGKCPDRIFADRSADPRIFDVQKLELHAAAHASTHHRPARCAVPKYCAHGSRLTQPRACLLVVDNPTPSTGVCEAASEMLEDKLTPLKVSLPQSARESSGRNLRECIGLVMVMVVKLPREAGSRTRYAAVQTTSPPFTGARIN